MENNAWEFVFILRLSRELPPLKKKFFFAMYKYTAKLETTNFYRKLKKDQRELGKIKNIHNCIFKNFHGT